MKLVADWQTVLKKAWSVKFNVAASLLAAVEVAVSIWQPASVPVGLFAGIAALVSIAANVARILAQGEITHDT